MFSTWGDIVSTSGHVQYIRGYHYECGGYHVYIGDVQYIGEVRLVHLGGGYHEYIGGCSAHQRDIVMHLGEQLDKSFQFLLKTPMYS